jgi:hypothetical protein
MGTNGAARACWVALETFKAHAYQSIGQREMLDRHTSGRTDDKIDDVPSDSGHMPECPQKSRLTDGYSAAINEFSRCAGIVNARMGTMQKGDYDRLSKSMDDARETSEQCHRHLLAHIAQHGC